MTLPPNPLERPKWPDPPGGNGDAAAELFKQQVAEVAERRKEFPAARHESQVAIETAQIEVSKSAIERARDSAKYIQTAASAIAVLYTGVAGLIFKVDSNHPLPVRGVIPILFLGTAIVFSSVYLTWFSGTGQLRPMPVGIDASNMRVARVQWFADWVSLSVLSKAWALRVATLTLAAGLMFLAAPFIPTTTAKSADPDAAYSATRELAAAPDLQLGVPAGATATSLPPWPEAPSGGDEFDQILYRAQVKEAAQTRAAAAEKPAATASSSWTVDEGLIWLAAALVAIAIAFTVYQQQTVGGLHKAILALTAQPGTTSQPGSTTETRLWHLHSRRARVAKSEAAPPLPDVPEPRED